MIKRFNKILAGITAAAALLLAAGCKNQLDYLNDTTARNAFNVAGLYVSGLDAGYNGANVALKVVAVDANGDKSEVDYVAGTVADSYTNDKGETVGHQSGTVYIKLDEAKLYDGDKMAVDYFNANGDADDYVAFSASSIECYLQVGSDTIKVLSSDGSKLENAKLSVPTSEAGTKDADLISRWVTVNVADGVGTFALAGNASEPINITMYQMKFDIQTATADNLPKGVEIKTSAKTGTNQKFTVTFTNVDENEGQELVLGGSSIGEADGTLADHWYYPEKFKQTVTDGKVSWTFYGGDVSYLAYRSYGAGCGPEFVIVAPSDLKENGVRFLESSASRSGGTGDLNFMFPKYTIGNYDVELTIDVKALDTSNVSKADPEAERSIIYVDAIKVVNAPSFNAAGYLAFCSNWFDAMGINKWGADTENKITSKDYFMSNVAYYVGPFDYHPNKSTFALDMQVLNPQSDGGFWDAASKVLEASTPTYQTSEFAGKHVIAVYELDASGTLVDAYIEASSKDSNIENLLTFSKKDIITDYFVKGWYTDSWTGYDVTKITKIDDHTWSWSITTTSEMKGYKFSIIPADGDWSDRYELANTYALSVDTEVGPLNHNNEPTRAEIDLSASKTYTFTVTNKNTGVYVKVTSN